MEENQDQSFNFMNPRFLLAAFAIVVTLAFVSGVAFSADMVPRAEERWDKVAVVMCDNLKETDK